MKKCFSNNILKNQISNKYDDNGIKRNNSNSKTFSTEQGKNQSDIIKREKNVSTIAEIKFINT